MTPYKRVFGRIVCQCKQCGWVWVAEGEELPARCAGPNCKKTTWNRDPQKRGRKPKADSTGREKEKA